MSVATQNKVTYLAPSLSGSTVSGEQSRSTEKLTDFSIEAILKTKEKQKILTMSKSKTLSSPGKIRKAEKQKRKCGRSPRVPFSCHQVTTLEDKFRQSAYLSSREVSLLAECLRLTQTRVKIWFQNRRARERREIKMREERQAVYVAPSHDQQSHYYSTLTDASVAERKLSVHCPVVISNNDFAYFKINF